MLPLFCLQITDPWAKMLEELQTCPGIEVSKVVPVHKVVTDETSDDMRRLQGTWGTGENESAHTLE